MELQDLVRNYGADYGRTGVISEHLHLVAGLGGRVVTGTSGRQYVLADRVAVPVLCSELIEVPTEDGPVSGRCGNTATVEGACAYHAEVIRGWRGQSEAEIVAWEKGLELS